MNIVILGPQASGKGTQAHLLAEKLRMFHLESGRLLRDIARDDPRINEIINVKGELVPDEEALAFIANELTKQKALSCGVIFDGYPRSINQYNLLNSWLAKRGQKIDKAIFLEVRENTLIERISSRRVCEKCGAVYNLITNPSPRKGVCECGGRLIQREDDKPETIKRRLSVYSEETQPLVDLMEKQGILIKVDGERPIDVIFEDILERLKTKDA